MSAGLRSDDFGAGALTKNLVYSALAFGLNLLLSFFLTPYLTARFGSEAYGYLKLANDLAGFAALLSIALNSMASRFLMLERAGGNRAGERQVFSSVGAANLMLAGGLSLPLGLCAVYLDRLLAIPAALTAEVKLTYALTFLNFLLQLTFSVYGNCYYLTNTLYLSALRGSQAGILNAVTVLGLFLCFSPRLSYVAMGALAATAFTAAANLRATRRLTPELRLRIGEFRRDRVRVLLASGVWNSVTRLSQILSTQLDLLITNLLIGAGPMGLLSVAKTVPNVIMNFNATLANVFSPKLMRLYAEHDAEGLQKATRTAMRFLCLFASVPNAILLNAGAEFYRLWVPGEPAATLHTLSLLVVLNSCVTGPIQPLYQIFTITDKVRENSLVMVAYGFVSLGATYVLLRVTSWGVYGILWVNLVGSLLMAGFYHLPRSARLIGLPPSSFFPEVGKSILSFLLVSLLGLGVKQVIPPEGSWLRWFGCALCIGALGFTLNLLLVLTGEERRILREKAGGRLRLLLGRA